METKETPLIQENLFEIGKKDLRILTPGFICTFFAEKISKHKTIKEIYNILRFEQLNNLNEIQSKIIFLKLNGDLSEKQKLEQDLLIIRKNFKILNEEVKIIGDDFFEVFGIKFDKNSVFKKQNQKIENNENQDKDQLGNIPLNQELYPVRELGLTAKQRNHGLRFLIENNLNNVISLAQIAISIPDNKFGTKENIQTFGHSNEFFSVCSEIYSKLTTQSDKIEIKTLNKILLHSYRLIYGDKKEEFKKYTQNNPSLSLNSNGGAIRYLENYLASFKKHHHLSDIKKISYNLFVRHFVGSEIIGLFKNFIEINETIIKNIQEKFPEKTDLIDGKIIQIFLIRIIFLLKNKDKGQNIDLAISYTKLKIDELLDGEIGEHRFISMEA